MRVTSLPYQITGFLHIIVANVDKKRKGTTAPSRVRKLRVKLAMMNFLVSELCVPVVNYLITPSIHFHTLFSLQFLHGYTLFILNLDPNWIPPNRIDTSSTQISPRRSEKRKSSLPSTCDGAPSNKKRKISECSYCGVPLKGHKIKGSCPKRLSDMINR